MVFHPFNTSCSKDGIPMVNRTPSPTKHLEVHISSTKLYCLDNDSTVETGKLQAWTSAKPQQKQKLFLCIKQIQLNVPQDCQPTKPVGMIFRTSPLLVIENETIQPARTQLAFWIRQELLCKNSYFAVIVGAYVMSKPENKSLISATKVQ